MSEYTNTSEGQERAIAKLLRYGTAIASIIIGVGLVVQGLPSSAQAVPPVLGGFDLVKVGVALFILLPVLRVALMLVLFLAERDIIYAAISALVLAIIGIGFLVGL